MSKRIRTVDNISILPMSPVFDRLPEDEDEYFILISNYDDPIKQTLYFDKEQGGFVYGDYIPDHGWEQTGVYNFSNRLLCWYEPFKPEK